MGGYRDREDDDDLHAPSARDIESGRPTLFTARGFANLGFLIFILLGIVFLFAGFPIWTHYRNELRLSNLGASGLGGTNASGQVPELSSRFALIDPDTPQSAFFHTSLETQAQWDLVFSDEFNVENRTFYPGDDPYWEAVDLHYYETDDLEYYDPSAIITQGGFLQITLSQQQNHGLDYMSGMLQSWNKFCFTGGYVEVSVSIPGLPSVSGLWPAVWTMGNLGRAGYGSTTDGTWPYSYDSCDVGTLANQTLNGSPPTALLGPNASPLSFLPGQRLSACTCPGEHHPGPVNSDGTFKGRSAPEIDVFEAIINVNGANSFGQVSQSAQTAPFDQAYTWNETQGTILTPSLGDFNNFKGAVFQESVSGLFETNQAAYSGLAAAGSAPTFATYGFEYKPGLDGYITWVNDGTPSWSVGAAATGANTITNISARPIPQEPMYLLANLAISPTFGEISASLTFPAVMYIDYVRVYQDPNAKNIGCSPKDFPTEDYINSYGTPFYSSSQTF
ncbi:glycoside hydrolase family 16 protein [Clavulina sp. PMI_390]|nr:glycoside hydrolase family 16 protein [Clavulina sp. PMI_390]